MEAFARLNREQLKVSFAINKGKTGAINSTKLEVIKPTITGLTNAFITVS